MKINSDFSHGRQLPWSSSRTEFSGICRSSPYHAYKGDLSLAIRIILIPLIIGLTVDFATGLLSFPFQVSTYILSTYLKNVGLFLPHASLLQVALTVVKLTDWLFLRISKSTYSETVFSAFCCPWKKNDGIFSFVTFKQHQISLEKTADISQPQHHWFPREMTSGKRVQKFHTDE